MILVDEQKLVDIAENIPKVFNAGYKTGYEEGKTESDDSLTTDLIQRDLTEIEISPEITRIGDYAFAGSKNLTKVSIPVSVKSIGMYAFADCANLLELQIPEGVTNLSNRFLQNAGVKEIEVPSTCKIVGNDTFSSARVEKVILKNGVQKIGANAFANCYNLVELFFPNSLISVTGAPLYYANISIKITLETGFNCNNVNLVSHSKGSRDFTIEQMLEWGEALYDRTGLNPYILAIGTNNIEKLTDEQIAIFTNKNWTLA